MWKRIFINLLLIITPFIIVESLARITYSVRNSESTSDKKENNPRKAHDILHHVWKPGVYHKSPRNIDITLKINNQRFVEQDDIKKSKSENSLRGVFVGDSNVQGVVNFEDKMVEIVEGNIGNILDEYINNVEFINSGTSSYSPIIYYVLIKEYLIEYNPDFIFLCVDMTDLANDDVYKKFAVKDNNGYPLRIIGKETKNFVLTPTGYIKRSFLERLKIDLIKYSKTVYYLNRLYYKIAKPKERTIDYSSKNTEVANWLKEPYDRNTKTALDNSLQYLNGIFDILKEKDIQIFLTGVPHYPQYTDRWSIKPHFLLDSLASANDVAYLNSYEKLKPKIKGSKQSDYYFDSDPTHFNVKGNLVWSDIISDFLLKNLILPEKLHAKIPEDVNLSSQKFIKERQH